MDSNQNKIVAREFLIFLSCFMIGILTYLFVFPYNYYIERKIEPMIGDTLQEVIIQIENNKEAIKDWEEEDVSHLTSYGYSLYLDGRPRPIETDLEKQKIYIRDFYRATLLINRDQQSKISKQTFFISLMVLFLLRYLIYAILWSFRTLKN